LLTFPGVVYLLMSTMSTPGIVYILNELSLTPEHP